MLRALIRHLSPSPSQSRLDGALLDACSRADEEQALFLLSEGASPTRRAPRGSSCLMFAARHDLPKLFDAIQRHPLCDCRQVDSGGRDALSWASARLGFVQWRGRQLLPFESRQGSRLFHVIQPERYDLDLLDAQGRHSVEIAIQSFDPDACIFWLARAPAAFSQKALDGLDAFARSLGMLDQARDWMAQSERNVISSHAPEPIPRQGRRKDCARL